MFPPNSLRFRRAISGAITVSLIALSFAVRVSAKNTRVVVTPKFIVGETLIYQVEMQTTTTGKVTTPIVNNEGASEAALKIGMRERLEVLNVASQDGSVRFRLTWDESRADAVSDALDPSTNDPTASFNELQGQSVAFTMSPSGALSNFKGLEGVLPGGMPPPESVAWIASLAVGNTFPRGGIEIQQRWKAERPISGSPLADLVWSTESTYDHNEACGPVGSAAPKTSQSGQCAVILSQMSIAGHRGSRSDQTPPDYLHNGLRTAGTWTGTGQEMGSIAIQTGLLMSATETSSQDMDYTITSASSGSSIHYTAKVQSQTGITLVSQSQ